MKLITGIVANWVARAGLQGKVGNATVGGSNVDAAFEVEFRIDEVRLGLGDLRSGLRFRGVCGEEFAFQISKVGLRLLKVGPLPGPGRSECRELLDPLFRQVDPWSQRGFFVRGIVKLIIRSPQRGLGGFYRRLEGHRVDLE